MNKWLMLAASSLMAMNAHANETFCGYKDSFRLSDANHPEISMVNGYTDSDLYLQQSSPNSFIIRDTEQCRSGFAHVVVAYDPEHWCILEIKDGPYMYHPSVNATCKGIQYINTTYDGFNSYSYSINLD